jgi:hypothetical protein
MGIASYWLVDIEEPAVTVLELDGEEYAEVVRLHGATRAEVARPFPVELAASDLTV